MRGRSGAGGGKKRAPSQHRGQSEIVGMVLLVAAIMIGAFLVIAVGGMALQSVEDSTEGKLTQDTALEAHSALAEAATTGNAQDVPVGEGAVDSRLVEGGELTVSMHDGASDCSQTVEEDLGALRYEGGDRAMIYEGGAIWAETESGLAIERTPPISHDEEATRVSVLSLSAASTIDGDRLVAEPNQSERERVAQETERLLTACPADGYTDFRINVTSPYHDAWERHFEEHVNTTANVTITRPTERSVVATIENATDPIETDGLGLSGVEAPTVLSPGDDFDVNASVANDDFDRANTTVELDVDGTGIASSRAVNLSSFDEGSASFSVDSGTISSTMTTGDTYDYTVTLRDESGAKVTETDGAVTFGTPSSQVELESVSDSLDPAHEDLTVTATLRNYGLQNGTGEVTLELTDPDLQSASSKSSGSVNVTRGAATDVAFPLDVADLPRGTYEYAIHGPNGTITDRFTISNRSPAGAVAGNIRIDDVQASATSLEVGEPFATNLTVENVAESQADGSVTLDVDGIDAVSDSVTLGAGADRSVETAIDAATLQALEPGQTHNYTLTLESDDETESLEGSFYLGEPGASLGVDDVSATSENGTTTVTATLANDGLAEGSDDATLSLQREDGEPVEFGTTPEQTVAIDRGGTSTVTFEFDTSSLGGEYSYEVGYGDDAESGTIELSALEEDDGGVAISGGGEGTVRVLGTEISGEGPNRDGPGWEKFWAPVSVSVNGTTDGDGSYQFENDGADVVDDKNLNSWDTQTRVYEHGWEQSAGESTTITIRSRFWQSSFRRTVNEREEHGRHWTDLQPKYGLGDPYRDVDASANKNTERVQVLTDGDTVPRVSGVLPDQRNASEILNQGAADRIDPETGKLSLDSNEAVFLFEMTANEHDYDDMWQYALENQVSDPDFNDVIAIVEFEPEGGNLDVEMDATDDGSGLVIETPGVSTRDGGEASIGDVDTSQGSGTGGGATPEAPGDGVESPSEPEDVEIDVDVVQVG